MLVLNDIHVADRPPASRAPGYTDQIFAKLEECGELAQDCDFVVITGDLFHSKLPHANSHRLVSRLIELFGTYPDVYVVPGNHDLAESGLSSIPRQPLGVLEAAGAVTVLLEDTLVFGEDELCVQLSPAPYTDDIDDDPSHYKLERGPLVHYAVKVAHGMLVPPKDSGHWAARHVAHTTFDQVASRKTDLVVWGHPHYDYGITTHRTTTFASLGSLSRVASTPQNRKRKIRVLTVEFTKQEMRCDHHTLRSMLPAADVFVGTHTSKGEDVELEAPLAAFARRLSSSLQNDSWQSLDQTLAKYAKETSTPVKKQVRHYLTEAGWD